MSFDCICKIISLAACLFMLFSKYFHTRAITYSLVQLLTRHVQLPATPAENLRLAAKTIGTDDGDRSSKLSIFWY